MNQSRPHGEGGSPNNGETSSNNWKVRLISGPISSLSAWLGNYKNQLGERDCGWMDRNGGRRTFFYCAMTTSRCWWERYLYKSHKHGQDDNLAGTGAETSWEKLERITTRPLVQCSRSCLLSAPSPSRQRHRRPPLPTSSLNLGHTLTRSSVNFALTVTCFGLACQTVFRGRAAGNINSKNNARSRGWAPKRAKLPVYIYFSLLLFFLFF